MSRRKGKAKKEARPASLAPPANPAAAAPKAALSPQRKWLFRLIGVVFVPLFILVVLEVLLRLAGYGYRTGFLERVHIGGREFFVDNETFSLRFFPPELARWPGPIQFPAEKPTNTFRIFILGESAARGEPEPPYAASRYLEALLSERFPGHNFEVINTGITAINSNVILPIARDCARQHGDVWIIYMGNNEMVGPFGAASVFGAKAPPLALIRLNLALQKLRVGQLIMDLRRKLKGQSQTISWGGMQMFLENQLAPDDPARDVVCENFHRNLRDIVQVGLNSGAKIILSTVAVNLKDCPPFASMRSARLSPADRAAFDGFYTNGGAAMERGGFTEAARCFEQAARLDARSADVQFRWGDCLLQLTNAAAAREHYQRACDDDALPFRTGSRLNELIRDVGRKFAGPDLVLFDAVAALETHSPSGICGGESFYEHVHFNFEGNYRLGLAWAEKVEAFLPATVRSRAAGDWASSEVCGRRLGLTDWNRCFVVDSVLWRLHRPPMSNQFNNPLRLAALQRESMELRRRMNAEGAAMARELHTAAIQRAPGDHFLHENFAEFLEAVGELKAATVEWRKVAELLPSNCTGHYQMGRLLEKEDQWAEAEAALQRAVKLRPSLVEGWFELGCVHLGASKFDAALRSFERARRLEPQNGTYCAFVGKALSKLNRRAEAIAAYRQAIQLDPNLWEAHFALGDELVAEEKIAEAQAAYEAVLRLQPTNALAHLNVGVMLARRGRGEEALRQFHETLRLDPANRQAQEYIERVRAWMERRGQGNPN